MLAPSCINGCISTAHRGAHPGGPGFGPFLSVLSGIDVSRSRAATPASVPTTACLNAPASEALLPFLRSTGDRSLLESKSSPPVAATADVDTLAVGIFLGWIVLRGVDSDSASNDRPRRRRRLPWSCLWHSSAIERAVKFRLLVK